MARNAAVVVLAFSLLLPAAPMAAADCQFVLGFAALKSLIDAAEGPDKVGNCLENQRSNPVNGDAVQQTTGGLMVWRKLDNWTAFTDGYRTWINGPHGLQARLNTETFDWEASPPPAPTHEPTPVPDYGAWEFHDYSHLLSGDIQKRASVFATQRQGYGSEIPRLTMRCFVGDDSRFNLYVVWYEHVGDDQHPVSYRFDDGIVTSTHGSAGLSAQDITFMPTTGHFGSSLVHGDHSNLVVEVTRYDDSTIAASWDISGAHAIFEKLWSSCTG